VESLPVASTGASARNGRIVVTAVGGWCSVAIDGTTHGSTPISIADLAPGPHKVECTAANGKTRGTTVNVGEGKTERYRFNLNE